MLLLSSMVNLAARIPKASALARRSVKVEPFQSASTVSTLSWQIAIFVVACTLDDSRFRLCWVAANSFTLVQSSKAVGVQPASQVHKVFALSRLLVESVNTLMKKNM